MKGVHISTQEHFIAAALTGLCGHEEFVIRAMTDATAQSLPFSELIARAAVRIGEATFREMNKPKEPAPPATTITIPNQNQLSQP